MLFLDADDRILPESLSFLSGLLKQRPNAVGGGRPHDPLAGGTDQRHVHSWPRSWMRVLSNHPRLFAMAMSAQACCPANGALIKTEPRVTPAGVATPTTARTGRLAVSLAMRGRIRIATQPTYECRIQRTITTLFPEMDCPRFGKSHGPRKRGNSRHLAAGFR